MQLCFDLIEKWVSKNVTNSILGIDGGNLNISGIASYQPFDGLIHLKLVQQSVFSLVLVECF